MRCVTSSKRPAIDRRFVEIDRCVALRGNSAPQRGGIARMMQACRAAGTPLSVLRCEPVGLREAFASTAGSGDQAAGAPVETLVEMRVEMREKIVALMAQHPAMSLDDGKS